MQSRTLGEESSIIVTFEYESHSELVGLLLEAIDKGILEEWLILIILNLIFHALVLENGVIPFTNSWYAIIPSSSLSNLSNRSTSSFSIGNMLYDFK